MDLSTTYLGLKLPHPFMPGASPLVDDLGKVKRLEDAGAAAIVMHSLFEEQIVREEWATFKQTEQHSESFAEALSYFPSPEKFALGPEEYLEHVRRVKSVVKVPVIASLNGTTLGGWLDYSRLLEQAGADALELNVYSLPSGFEETGQAIEDRTVEMLKAVKQAVKIPVAVKLSPFYTSMANFAHRLDEAGADGLVLFNRFYQPDIDPHELKVVRSLALSDSSELPLRLRWLAILSGRTKASLAVTGGVHTCMDAVKAIMTGAHAVQLVSALLHKGPEYLEVLKREVLEWMEEMEYASIEQMRGSLGLRSAPDPSVYERANYMMILQSWREQGQ
jgi:dihydroorotate dehydrogenase (fumarate)